MTAYYDTLIVTFSDPIRILDMMCTDTCDVATLKEWIFSLSLLTYFDTLSDFLTR